MEVLQKAGKNRAPEENARREKIRKLLQMANVSSVDDIPRHPCRIYGEQSGDRTGRPAGLPALFVPASLVLQNQLQQALQMVYLRTQPLRFGQHIWFDGCPLLLRSRRSTAKPSGPSVK